MPKKIYAPSPNLDMDDVFAAIITAHDGLSETQSHALNARLVLLMANAIGDIDAVTALCQTARTYTD